MTSGARPVDELQVGSKSLVAPTVVPVVTVVVIAPIGSVVVHDSLGICDELEALMAAHVANYRDEWADTINDPERLSRFVSFVNAPDVADPTVAFTERSGRKVPMGMPKFRPLQETT